jgi:L-lactate dehydrogenase complex protein LldG
VPEDRDEIFDALRAALAGTPAHTPLPDWPADEVVAQGKLGRHTPADAFAANFTAAGGVVVRSLPRLAEFLLAGGHRCGFCVPGLRDTVGSPLELAGLAVAYDFARELIDQYAFSVTMATAAIAESGSLVLDDRPAPDPLASVAPWVQVAVLDPATVVRTIPDGIALLGTSGNTLWVTGPSKTADIEGILVKGVHGPGVQVCLMS